jgi:hypothetical protein
MILTIVLNPDVTQLVFLVTYVDVVGITRRDLIDTKILRVNSNCYQSVRRTGYVKYPLKKMCRFIFLIVFRTKDLEECF